MFALGSLTRLKIRRYRFVEPDSELFFRKGINLLVGKNGTGKTTLLDLVGKLASGNFAGLADEEFDADYDLEIRGGLQGHFAAKNLPETVQAHHGPLRFRLDARFEPSAGSPNLCLSIDGDAVSCDFGDKHWTTNLGGRSPFQPDINIVLHALERVYSVAQAPEPPSLLPQLNVELGDIKIALAHPLYAISSGLRMRFDEALNWLDETMKSARLRFGVEENQIVTPFESSGIPFGWLLAMEEMLASSPDTVELKLVAGDTATESAALEEVLGFHNVSMHLALETRQPRSDGTVVVVYGGPRFFFTKRDGSRVPLDRLSFGQKRLFGFYYYLLLAPPVVVADELANGLHHAMVSSCLENIGGKQAFLATQNPLLIDFMTFRDSRDVQSGFVLCELRQRDSGERWWWGRMSDEDAEDFFRDYEIGVQEPNDLLRARGLW